MKNIKRYKDFIKEAIDMPPKAPAPIEIQYQAPDKYSTEDTYVFNPSKDDDTLHKVTKSKSEMQKMTKYQHWTLDSTKIETKWDTIVKKAPNTKVLVLDIKLTDDQYFRSGSFVLDQSIKTKIDSLLTEVISNDYVITDIGIESSTDMQNVGPNVKKNLESNGYVGDNSGLATARAESISKYLDESGIDTSLISIQTLPEQNLGGADKNGREQAARYVTVSIAVLGFEDRNTPDIIEIVPKIKNTYYLSKVVDDSGTTYPSRGKRIRKREIGDINKVTRKKVKECILPGKKVKYNKRTGLYSN